ncbi:MAG: trypsin-like serine protease [Alphaproteobacteria bacterium]|nr:trypsin-like serine protease [Alphaproteobacteria bacterium]
MARAGESHLARALRLVAAAFALALSAASALAQQTAPIPQLPPPILPGIGEIDPRTRVDINALPWRAIGKLQATTGNLRINCTGTLVGPATVLTAGHCVFNIRTQAYFPPSSLHFLIGYESGRYAGEARGTQLVVGPGYDPKRAAESFGSDWALVTLDRRLGTPDRVLTIRETPPEIGMKAAIGGYSQDHPLLLTADAGCRVVALAVDPNGRRLLRHNCTGTEGSSGAPLLVQDDGVWHVGGVQVGAERGVAAGVAVMLDEVRKKL